MRFLLALLLAPLLLAPVRLRDSTPSFFTPPGQSPAPEAFSLPAAEPLITPTVVQVSPTLVPESSTSPTDIPSSTLNLPLPPSPTVVPSVSPRPQASPNPNLMTPTSAAMCQRALLLVKDIGMVSYEQKRNPAVLKLALASAAALPEVRARQWPNLAAFRNAESDLPWFFPSRAEVKDAAGAANALCSK